MIDHNLGRLVRSCVILAYNEKDQDLVCIQVWLTLCTLLVEPKCREKYSLDDYRRERILSLRRYFNEILFDQLPILRDLERSIDHMILGVGPMSTHAASGFVIEQVCLKRAHLKTIRNYIE